MGRDILGMEGYEVKSFLFQLHRIIRMERSRLRRYRGRMQSHFAICCRNNRAYKNVTRLAGTERKWFGIRWRTDIGSRQRQNGSMHVKQERTDTGMEPWMRSLGIVKMPTEVFKKLGQRKQMRGDFTICWETFGSGAGTSTIRSFMARTGCFAAAVGLRKLGAAGRHAGDAAIHPSASMIWAFGWPGLCKKV